MGTVRLLVESDGPGTLLGDGDLGSRGTSVSAGGMGNP